MKLLFLNKISNINSFKIINLLEQNLNNLYTLKSEFCFFGKKYFALNEDDPLNHILVVSSVLRPNVLKNNVFEKSEIFKILRHTWSTYLGMRPPDLSYVILNNFGALNEMYYFEPQEILNGKSFCDISLSNTLSVSKALELFKD